jgi:hypothetical protein
MTTDMERELRELFRDKAGEAPVSTLGTSGAAPQQVLRRGRRRQVGTVLGSILVAATLAVGSFAGLRSLIRSDQDPFRAGHEYEVFERTATVEAFTITSPSDWFLVNQWPLSMLIAVEGSSGVSSPCPADVADTCQTSNDQTSSPIPLPHGLPMLQLSNVDLGLTTNACADGLPAGAAALYVALDAHPQVGGDAPPIQEFPSGNGLPSEGDGACGPGRYAHFKVNGEPLFAWIGIGSGVSDEDRDTVENSYETMSAIPDWEHAPPKETTPAYVIAGGSADNGDPWRLELRPGEQSPELSLEGVDLSFVGVDPRIDHDPVDPAIPIEICCGWTDGGDTVLVDVTFGFVRKDATGVELQVAESDELTGQILPGMIVPIPPTLGSFGSDLFFIPGTAGLAGQVVPLGIDGSTEPSVATDRAGEVRLNGALLGQNWGARFTGAFADESACIRVTIDEAYEPLCIKRLETSLAGTQPSMHLWVTDDLALFAGSVPWPVVDIRFTSDDGTTRPMELQCTGGPAGWTDPDKKVCAIALPPEGSGTFEYLDGDGAVLFEEGNGWASATAEAPSPVEPVHGGTYWAVYPWVGDAGSREADDVSAWLLQEFGIEAFPGDLACDQGAAETLGTDAEQGIGVYFETDDEANAFALQAGLLDHTRRVIAHVTTYCLD